ncbi:EamA family transporter [Streptomyces tsukubensis]|uniref:EamA family transporter n=1 Tax=Streptomyces tsukubensis (strain DSM 42081 / NBRC 108919 / NRRL 18488 / 9993) TaxID=1114943 RepID=A0A7G3UN78_STRT9|nr:EamA family transporter [Streptomyces tsukubensis]MYS65815.1 EamA family transporter [Streptomyces sp. SID5473]QKM71746.1 EamA family transporter [Streptomyces tsukubensis NRRL18488]TAI43022.1 EamA family transporter [Streptomyces tsukubensis]
MGTGPGAGPAPGPGSGTGPGPASSPGSGTDPAAAGRSGRGTRRQLGPVGLVVAGALSVQFGAAVAVLLMDEVGPTGVVTLRLVLAALVMFAVCRPRLRGHSRADWGTVIAFGLAMGGMNILFYQAVDRIPLGPAVTLEVLGPLALSVIVSRRLVNLVWAALALAGVFLLSGMFPGLGGGGVDGLDPVGAAYALGAGAMWAAYIVFSARTGRRFPQADGLALAFGVAAVLSLPFGIAGAGTLLADPVVIGLGLAVALMSSVLPYTLELLALRRLPASTFAVMMSLEPAVACLAGFLVLRQALSVTDALAIALVIAASVGAVRTQAGRAERPKRTKRAGRNTEKEGAAGAEPSAP